jgi:hypothetical protein
MHDKFILYIALGLLVLSIVLIAVGLAKRPKTPINN